MNAFFFLRMVVTLLFFSLSFSSCLAWDEHNGLVSFDGKIIESPCYLDDESADQSIDMGQQDISNISGPIIALRTVEIKLRGCRITNQMNPEQSWSTANIVLEGRANEQDSSLWAVSGDADGIALKIIDRANSVISAGGSGIQHQLIDGDNTIQFAVQLVSVMKTITPGSWYSLISFRVLYY
ncbi:hypothetical protein FJU30_17830 [Affinibrenneria salicis]|uniref:Type 1 fimbrial protein n=1 Tax=Affinibrenneria salicis TaxID=2590031 RepID=A0A5J5FVV9_9GAMM|nr:hypothetical protein [Affinibrenneria salicis]KAA8997635.1 hypothetical protein FJU30_17830 [Affinibrenneria salicis]